MKREALVDYLAKLGIDDELSAVYLALQKTGPQTISELARSSGIERTKIYRRLDQLQGLHLVELERRGKSDILRASPVETLQLLIAEREQEVEELKKEFPLVSQMLTNHFPRDGRTHVQHYKGIEGMRQMQWNLTRSKTTCLTIIDEPIQTVLGDEYSKRWANEMNRNGVGNRLIVSPRFHEANRNWYLERKNGELLNEVSARMVDPTQFEISINVDIWDDVVSFYNWSDGEIVGVEIHNSGLAALQRQLFEMLWNTAEPQVTDW